MPNPKFINKKNNGFTIVEILIIAPIMILVIGSFIIAIISMTGDVMVSRSSDKLVYEIQSALKTIEQDVRISGAFLATNNFTLRADQGSDNLTSPFYNARSGDNGTSLILNAYTTTSNPLNSIKNLYYKPLQAGNCNSLQSSPAMYNIVYYTSSNTLWRRTLMPDGYNSGCIDSQLAPPWQQPSCSPGYTNVDFCKTDDIRLVDNLADNGFSVTYLSSPSSSTIINDASDSNIADYLRQNAMTNATTVSITINGAKTVAGRDITQTGMIKAISPNNNISN